MDPQVIQHHIDRIIDAINVAKSSNESILNDSSTNSYLSSIVTPSTSSILPSNSLMSLVKRRNILKTIHVQEQQKESEQMPDHEIDPWTKMLFLTPVGRTQV